MSWEVVLSFARYDWGNPAHAAGGPSCCWVQLLLPRPIEQVGMDVAGHRPLGVSMHCSFARSSRANAVAGISFQGFRFGVMAGRPSSHALRSAGRMMVDLPRLRARSSPRLIASYKVVRPEREAEQASLIVSAIGAIWFDIGVSSPLAGMVPAIMPMSVIGHAGMASRQFRKK